MTAARQLAGALDDEIPYDDGASAVPFRRVLIRPSGERFEVFERTDSEDDVIVLDPKFAPKRL